ncbi:MAG TPA: hypothetical protein VFC46_11425 [Humisphaera sp.]|nr:hypothetical protein [Humisphaera sp.]
MEISNDIVTLFSKLRLQGEPVPADVKVLLDHNEELFGRTGIRLNWDENWAPWLDTSYLRPEELAKPDIAANIRAISEVCSHIAFVAAHEDAEYYGYWRGIEGRPVSISPLVVLDNEGQFRLCRGTNLVEALLERTYGEERFDELRQWFISIGFSVAPKSMDDLAEPPVSSMPKQLHKSLYSKYLG